MTLHELPDLVQGTDEWFDQRRGIVTASVVGQLITVGTPDALTIECPACSAEAGDPCLNAARKVPTPIKTPHAPRTSTASDLPPTYETADNETSRGLTATLIAERITGWTEDSLTTFDMRRGVEAEPYARDAYSEHHAPAVEVGFMLRDEDDWQLGYSPDGLVGDDGLIEIKAPRAKAHLRTILADEVPAFYMPQLQAGLLVSGRDWIDFVSYVGGMPLYVKRVTPDLQWQVAIVAAVEAFMQAAYEMEAAYHTATHGLAATERIEFGELELKL